MLQLCHNYTTTILFFLLLSVCCSIVVRLLSVHLTDNKRTSNVLQTDSQPCYSIAMIWLKYGKDEFTVCNNTKKIPILGQD